MTASGLRTSFGSKISGNPLHQENKFNLQTKKVVGCASSKEYSDPNDLRAEIQKNEIKNRLFSEVAVSFVKSD